MGHSLQPKKHLLALCLIIVLYLAVTLTSLLNYPPIWPDEAINADIARNLIQSGIPKSSIMAGIAPFIQNHVYYYPHLYFYLLAGVIKTFGNQIVSMRILSVLFGIGTISIFYFSAKLISNNKLFIFILTLLFALDFYFLRSARMGRPEAVVLVFMLASYFTLQRAKTSSGLILWIVTGLLCSLAFQSHFIGSAAIVSAVISLIISDGMSTFRSIKFRMMVITFIVISLPTIIPIVGNIHESVPQIESAQASRLYFSQHSLFPGSISNSILTQFEVLVSLVLVIIGISFDRMNNTYIYLLVTWIWTIVGKLGFYVTYTRPFFLLSIASIIIVTNKKKLSIRYKRAFVPPLAIVFLIFTLNLKASLESTITAPHEAENYLYASWEIVNIIPPGSSVYLSTIPEMYFAFPENRNRLLAFPSFPAPLENFQKNLSDVDYVITNYFPEKIFYGDFLKDYLNNNAASSIHLNYYDITIWKLKQK